MKLYGLVAVLSALLLSPGASAQSVVTLDPAGGFGALHQYHEVTTDATPDDPVTMYLPQAGATGGMQLWFDSEVAPDGTFLAYWRGTFTTGLPATLQRYACAGGVCSPTGEQLSLQIVESTRRVCTKSGRGQTCHTLWTLLGGTITRL